MKQAQSFPFHLTLAESCISLLSNLNSISEEWLESFGASKVVEMSCPEIVCRADDSDTEIGPDMFDTNTCDYVLYQFKDGSLIWYVRSTMHHYLQLRGMYNGKFRHTNYIKAGERVTEYGVKYEYPLIWDDELWSLNVSVMVHQLLWDAGIRFVGELVSKSKFELLKIKGFGSVKLGKLMEEMEKHNLSFDTDTRDWKAPQNR